MFRMFGMFNSFGMFGSRKKSNENYVLFNGEKITYNNQNVVKGI